MGLASKIAGLIMAVPGVVFAGEHAFDKVQLRKDIDYVSSHVVTFPGGVYSENLKENYFEPDARVTGNEVGYVSRFVLDDSIGCDTLYVNLKFISEESIGKRKDLEVHTAVGSKNLEWFTDKNFNSYKFLDVNEGDSSMNPPYYPGREKSYVNKGAANEAYARLLRRLANHIMPKK